MKAVTESELEEVSLEVTSASLLATENAADAEDILQAAPDTAQANEDTHWADRPGELKASRLGDSRWVEQGELRERKTRVPNYLVHASINKRAADEDLRAIHADRFCLTCGATLRENRRCRKCEPRSPHLYRKQASGITKFEGHAAGCYLYGELYVEADHLWDLAYGATHRKDWFEAYLLFQRLEALILAEHELASMSRIARLVSPLEDRVVSKDQAKSAMQQVRKKVGVGTNVELRAKVLKGLWYLATESVLRMRPGGSTLPGKLGAPEKVDPRQLVGSMFAA